MLSLQLKSGEYFTIGEDIVVQVFHDSSAFRVLVKAPRELSILRGNVLERGGEQRPDNILKRKPENRYERERNAQRMEALRERKAQKEAEKKRSEEKEAVLQSALEEMLELLEDVPSPKSKKQLLAIKARLGRFQEAPEKQELAANG